MPPRVPGFKGLGFKGLGWDVPLILTASIGILVTPYCNPYSGLLVYDKGEHPRVRVYGLGQS